MNIRDQLSDLSKCQAIILGSQYDLKPVIDIQHAIEKRQELWRYFDVSSYTIREWMQTVFKKVTPMLLLFALYKILVLRHSKLLQKLLFEKKKSLRLKRKNITEFAHFTCMRYCEDNQEGKGTFIEIGQRLNPCITGRVSPYGSPDIMVELTKI